MSGVRMWRGTEGGGIGGYQPGVYVPLEALFQVFFYIKGNK